MEKAVGLAGCGLAVGTGKGEDVQLQLHIHVAKTAVVGVVHIHIALWVSQQWRVALLADARQDVVEAHGRMEVGGLD